VATIISSKKMKERINGMTLRMKSPGQK